MAAAHVDYARKSSKIVSLSDCFVTVLAKSNHRALEESSLVRMIGQPIEPGFSEHLVESRQPRPHRMAELSEGMEGLSIQHSDQVARTGARVGTQRLTQFAQSEATGHGLAKEAFSGQQSHDSVKSICIGV